MQRPNGGAHSQRRRRQGRGRDSQAIENSCPSIRNVLTLRRNFVEYLICIYHGHYLLSHVLCLISHQLSDIPAASRRPAPQPSTVGYRDFPPPFGLSPLYEPSLALRVVPLGVVLLLYASIIPANIFELSPPEYQPSFRNCPPGGDKSR